MKRPLTKHHLFIPFIFIEFLKRYIRSIKGNSQHMIKLSIHHPHGGIRDIDKIALKYALDYLSISFDQTNNREHELFY